ncbi:MAG: hypothetical protein ABI234_15460 [Ktedonobacteraceae bacterium]
MRVAAVALVLIVGAAVVLAFANTLNSWVLGGLLGGLAALLLSIPISLALFTLLARRHDTFQRSMDGSFEDEPEFAEDFYDEHVVYETELSYDDEDLPVEPRARYLLEERRLPASGYLRLPAAGHSQAPYEEENDQEPVRHPEPRNYPRQPRSSSRSQERETGTQISQSPQRPTPGEIRRQTSTHALSQHQSEALRVARQEAQQPRSGSGSLSRRPQPQESRAQALQRARASRQLRTRPSTFRAQRPLDERDTWVSQQEDERLSWQEEEDFSNEFATDQLSDSYQHYPRRASYPRQPRSEDGRSVETWQTSHEDRLDEPPVRRSRDTSERMSGSLHNPLVRRAPYLYNDDPMREEFAQQLENGRPIRRRSSRYARHENDEEW